MRIAQDPSVNRFHRRHRHKFVQYFGLFALTLAIFGILEAAYRRGADEDLGAKLDVLPNSVVLPESGARVSADSYARNGGTSKSSNVVSKFESSVEVRETSIPRVPIQIVLPDGSIAIVHVRTPPPQFELPDARDSESWVRLRFAASGGDGEAAFALYQALQRCEMSKSDSNTALSDNICSIGSETGDADRWLTMGVDAGEFHSIRERARQLGATAEARDLYQLAWQHGQVSALGRLAELFLDGFEEDGLVLKDHVLGVSHLWLQIVLQQAVSGGGRASYLRDLRAKFDRYYSKLSPHEIDAAAEQASKIFGESIGCCMGP